MILILPLPLHLLESSDDIQLAFENAPSRPCSSAAPGWFPVCLSLQAGRLANDEVACPSQQVISLRTSHATNVVEVEADTFPASRATDLVAVEAVSLPASQATNLVGVEVATLVDHVNSTRVAFEVASLTGAGHLCGVLVLPQKVGISSDPSRSRNRSLALLLLSAFSPLSRL